MGRYSMKLEMHLKEFRPELYRELKLSGRTRTFCLERENEALEQKRQLMDCAGLTDWEADEIVVRELLSL